MPGGRLIRLSKVPGEIEFPVYLVAADGRESAIEVLKGAAVLRGREPQDIGPISERVMHRLCLRPGQFMLLKARNER
jgi:hypothetical protein